MERLGAGPDRGPDHRRPPRWSRAAAAAWTPSSCARRTGRCCGCRSRAGRGGRPRYSPGWTRTPGPEALVSGGHLYVFAGGVQAEPVEAARSPGAGPRGRAAPGRGTSGTAGPAGAGAVHGHAARDAGAGDGQGVLEIARRRARVTADRAGSTVSGPAPAADRARRSLGGLRDVLTERRGPDAARGRCGASAVTAGRGPAGARAGGGAEAGAGARARGAVRGRPKTVPHPTSR